MLGFTPDISLVSFKLKKPNNNMKRKYLNNTLICLSFVAAIYINSETHHFLKSFRSTLSFEQRDGYLFPKTSFIRALTLNYSTFAASIMWIQLLVYFGDWRLSKHKLPPRHLEEYATAVIELDSSFYPVYPWISATYINSRLETTGVTHEDLLNLSKYLVAGQKHFPNEYELTYLAGLNFLGYSKGRNKTERLTEYKTGIRYLEQCLQHTGCPAVIVLTVKQMRRKARQLEKSISDNTTIATQTRVDLETLIQIYQTNSDPTLHKRLQSELQQQGVDTKLILNMHSGTFRQEYQESTLNYVRPNDWALLSSPVVTQ